MVEQIVVRCPYCKKKAIPHAFKIPRLQFCGDLNCKITSCIGCDRSFMVKEKDTIRSWAMEKIPAKLRAYKNDPPRPKQRGGPLVRRPPDSSTESL